MQTALTGGEKLPAIFENLNSQMSSIGRIVPEKISVDIAIVEEHELSEMSYNPGAHQSDIQFRWNF
jgi:hypothetical protein